MDADKFCAQLPIQTGPVGSWASKVIDYFDLKTGLLAIESKEASQHFVELLTLVGAPIVLASSGILIRGAFLLYLVSLPLHLAWSWSAVILSLACVLAFLLLRLRLRKPVFRIMLKDLERINNAWVTRRQRLIKPKA